MALDFLLNFPFYFNKKNFFDFYSRDSVKERPMCLDLEVGQLGHSDVNSFMIIENVGIAHAWGLC